MQDIFTSATALGAETWGNILLDATIKGILMHHRSHGVSSVALRGLLFD